MFTTAVKGAYPKYTSPPRPSLVARAIRQWRQKQITGEELERAMQRAEVETVAEMVAAGMEVVWDGQLRWDSPAYLLREFKGVDPWINQMVGVQAAEPHAESDSTDTTPFEGNGHQPHAAFQEKVKISGKIEWQKPILADTYRFLAERTPVDLRPVLTGPVSLSQFCDDGWYGNENSQRIIDIAKALHREIEGLVSAGAGRILIEEPLLIAGDVERLLLEETLVTLTDGIVADFFLSAENAVTTDETFLQIIPFKGVTVDARRLDPVEVERIAGRFQNQNKLIELGVIDGRSQRVETPEEVCDRMMNWGKLYNPDLLWVSSTSGLGGLSRETAYLKLQSLARGVELARREISRDE